jgi:hypothetical protein
MLLILLLFPFLSQAEIRLTPQLVVSRILSEGRDSRAIELEALSAYTQYYSVGAAYDLSLAGRASYEDNRLASLSGGGNLRDKTTIWSAVLSKRVPTGTVFEIGYNRTLQDSTFRTTSLRERAAKVIGAPQEREAGRSRARFAEIILGCLRGTRVLARGEQPA